MPRYAALLRGVNVGKGNRVPMAELRALLEALGCTRVRTLLNSGNAVFASPGRSAPTLATRIRAALAERVGVDVPVMVKSADEVAAIFAGNSLAAVATDPSRLLVAFAASAPDLAGLAAIRPLVRAPERFVIGPHAAYLWCPHGSLESKAGAALLGKPGRAVTTRNWATVGKLLALLDS
jgi:uncharacterized protein (DUF1697 family)